MGEQCKNNIDRMMTLVFKILEDQNMNTEVKITGIMAIGDICLNTESAFKPYLEKAMNTLISAGQMSIQIDKTLPVED